MDAATHSSSETHEIPVPGDDRATILIVDDERGPRESLRMILSPSHEVLLASSGVSALEILRTTPVDLVTVDLNMPGMLGEELIRTIREELPHIEIMIITGCGSVETAIEGIRYGICDYLTKPFDVVQVTAAATRALERRQSRKRLVAFLAGIGEVLGRDRSADEVLTELGENDAVRARLRQILLEPALDPGSARSPVGSEQSIECLEVLAEAIEARNPGMRGHARRVAFYAGLLADRICLSAEEQAHVRISSFLHDLGKVGVPNDGAGANGELDPEEQRALEQHPAAGERLVKPLGFSSGVASAIRHHHERWDGTGYPDGLRSQEIPLASRIIAVVDAYDALVSGRQGEPAACEQGALGALRKRAGSEYDPSLVEHFAAIVETGVDASSVTTPRGDAQ